MRVARTESGRRFLSELAREFGGRRGAGQFAGDIRCDEPLSRHTTMKVGGPADVLVIPRDLDELRSLMVAASRADLAVTVLGGSNMIVRDHGIAGVVVKLSQLNRIRRVGADRVMAEAGVLLPRLARAAARFGLSGLEFAAGIPGTVGGSIVMNAGTRDAELAPLLESVTIVGWDGEFHSLGRSSLSYRYRHTELPTGCVVSAQFKLQPAATSQIEATMTHLLKNRRQTQPLHFPSAGCIFRNPPVDSAGRLIEAAGMKGFSIGDAEISSRHANFIINRGHATAGEVMALIRHVGRRVEEMLGVTLELEVKIIGRTVKPRRSGGVSSLGQRRQRTVGPSKKVTALPRRRLLTLGGRGL